MPHPALFRPVRLLTTRGVLRIVVCRLCAALVAVEGAEQHARAHAAQLGDGGRGDVR